MISQYLGFDSDYIIIGLSAVVSDSIDSYHCKYSADAEAEKSIQSIYERKKR